MPRKSYVILGGTFDSKESEEKIRKLKSESEQDGFWSNPDLAKKIMQQLSGLENNSKKITEFDKRYSDIKELFELAQIEKDKEVLNTCQSEINDLFLSLENEEFKIQFNGKADDKSCYIEIHAGAGGTESQDWAQMLTRMYFRWAEKNNFKFKLINETFGDEAGIKSCTALIEGDYAFGYLKKESGIHRLVRISPFDSNSRRHTSFSSVWISPHVDDDVHIEILDKDIRIDTFRASGAGGQHVNTTDSAIRITHIPTSLVVQCQNERSQHKNKATAMSLLKSKMYEKEIKKLEDERKATEDQKTEIGWGNQIRSYVLHPYRMVKDLRSNFEDPDPESVLDGNIDNLIKSNFKR